MHQIEELAGQYSGGIGAGDHVPEIDVSRGELPVHVPSRLLVCETVIRTGADALQADRLRWQQDRIVQDGNPGSDAESLQEPGADHTVINHRIAPGGQSACRRTGGLGDDLVLPVGRGGPGRDVALINESEELVSGDQGAEIEEPR